jgi:hypothetical protein
LQRRRSALGWILQADGVTLAHHFSPARCDQTSAMSSYHSELPGGVGQLAVALLADEL